MTAHVELFEIAEALEGAANSPELDLHAADLARLEEAASVVAKASSGSWMGYHANVYYRNFASPPPGAHFDLEWGLKDMSFTSLGTRGEWGEVDANKVLGYIRNEAGNPDLGAVTGAAEKAETKFAEARSDIRSILATVKRGDADVFIDRLLDEIEAIKPMSPFDFLNYWSPKGQKITRDLVAAQQGTRPPPHMVIRAEVTSLRQSFAVCSEGAKIARRAASHLQRKERRDVRDGRVGTNVFIGHGRSTAWRELKDFVQDRLRLPYDEFNRVPVAGVSNQARLSEMLDAAAVALLIMTAEDETAEGSVQARMNVIHEVGLFQGRLGFTRAIVLLEEGCSEFSNIHGVGQIRFPRGNISASFEEVRRVLEREALIG